MKNFYSTLFAMFAVSCVPFMADAAYYNNGSRYQNNYSQQGRYGANNYGNQYAAGRYGSVNQQNMYGRNNYQMQNQRMPQNNARGAVPAQKKNSANKQGFFGDAGLSHEFGQWKFDMNDAGSQLHYDNLAWNVLTVGGKYYFDGETPVVAGAGLRYGMQYDKATMIDDDISNGAMDAVPWTDEYKNVIGYQASHALSIGTSQNGKQLGFNAYIGLTDAFNWGKVKMTPSVGYRYFRHQLTTEKNYGLTMDIFHAASADSEYITCITEQAGEVKCIPYLAFIIPSQGTDDDDKVTVGGYYVDENGNFLTDIYGNLLIPVTTGATALDIGNTFYYEQYNKSHSYDTSWAGPYVALDMVYDINDDNSFVGGIELGLPVYDAKGDQPYRSDWQHPVSVEDKGSLGDAIHLGLNANWMTAITDTMSLTFGFTYDFYKVSGAKATTYFNSEYYINTYNTYLEWYQDESDASTYQNPLLYDLLYGQYGLGAEIAEHQANGWKVEQDNEVNSIYKSLGLRIGLVAKF